jgi:kinesin family protein 2/24
MDRFYLDNAVLYQALVKSFNSTLVSRPFNTATGTIHPDMVVSARVRPLMSEDIAAGYSNAVYPLSTQTGVVYIHDLYNHPRGRPILKV